MPRAARYRTIWRWHFYAGLMVIPFVLILAVTGAFYLFKPQVERWEERRWLNMPAAVPASPDMQRDAALAALPGAAFESYRLPRKDSDAAMIRLALPNGHRTRDVFVSPVGKVVGIIDPETRLMTIDQKIHGQLLLGKTGSWLVELVASWAIVMILTGLYLWWPRGRGPAGVVWPRINRGRGLAWRDLHAVTGFWTAGLALVLLITGLPWTAVWGSAFKAVRTEMSWITAKQDWTIGGQPVDTATGHDHGAAIAASIAPGSHHLANARAITMAPATLGAIVVRAKIENLAFPVIISPPRQGDGWIVRSEAQNRPLRVTLRYEAMSGALIARETFADKHPIDQVIGYGVAWHEGQLFGRINQLIGVATAAMLITLALSGLVLWRRRRPFGQLGAPLPPSVPLNSPLITVFAGGLMVLLPLFALSIAAIWFAEWAVLSRIPRTARWLGLN